MSICRALRDRKLGKTTYWIRRRICHTRADNFFTFLHSKDILWLLPVFVEKKPVAIIPEGFDLQRKIYFRYAVHLRCFWTGRNTKPILRNVCMVAVLNRQRGRTHAI